jgi:hypothetical protein
VLIAPVSTQIPWYQGILQGILRFWGLETRFSTKKPLRCSHFASNSLRKLTAKIFWGTANVFQVSRNLDPEGNYSRVRHVYDQNLLNIPYDPYVRPGMTKEEVNGLLPEVLRTVHGGQRQFTRHANGRRRHLEATKQSGAVTFDGSPVIR